MLRPLARDTITKQATALEENLRNRRSTIKSVVLVAPLEREQNVGSSDRGYFAGTHNADERRGHRS
jgi:hypothetical protein